MELKDKIIQIYALIICIVAIIAIIISISSLISALIDRKNPLYASRYELNLASFENFKMEILKSAHKEQAYIPDDTTIQKMYEAAKADKIKFKQHQTYRTIVVSSLIIGISLLLFGFHWWLMRSIGS